MCLVTVRAGPAVMYKLLLLSLFYLSLRWTFCGRQADLWVFVSLTWTQRELSSIWDPLLMSVKRISWSRGQRSQTLLTCLTFEPQQSNHSFMMMIEDKQQQSTRIFILDILLQHININIVLVHISCYLCYQYMMNKLLISVVYLTLW